MEHGDSIHQIDSEEFKAFEVYLKRVWFASGIHHHYGCEKFKPGFSEEFFYQLMEEISEEELPLREGRDKGRPLLSLYLSSSTRR